MRKVKVKPEYADEVYGFNNSAAPLGQRDDLHLLLKDAKHNNLKDIIAKFEEVSDEDIKEDQAKKFEEKQTAKNEGKAKSTG